ncbi:MAG: TPM domain-containing protein [Phycisphaerae bacterium]|nr:TPM domain-containing protein [Phycisphaerae bacterium]
MSTVRTRRPIQTARLAGAVALTLLAVGEALAAQPPRPPSQHVEDLADVIDDQTEKKLIGYLEELEQKTGAQFIVLTLPSTDAEPIDKFAFRLAQGWKLGQKGKDNGLLLVVAVTDCNYRFETGYGLEAPLPDSLLGTIGRTYLVPNFKRGDYAKGIHDAVAAVLDKLEQHYGMTLKGVPNVRVPARQMSNVRLGRPGALAACGMGPMITICVAIIVLSSVFRRWLGFWGMPMYFGSRRSHFGGGWGGGGGGGFGGFGGGGGGSFGGGGASGSW